jgi:hypothetical protein
MTQIISAYGALTSSQQPNRPVNIDSIMPSISPEIDGNIGITVLGQEFRVDLTENIKTQIRSQLADRLRRFERQRDSIQDISSALYNTYLRAIDSQRNSRVVQQVEFSQEDLLRYKIISNKSGDGYDFYMPATYEPTGMIRDSVRYELSPVDKLGLKREDLFFAIHVTASKTFRDRKLIDKTGSIFVHYHGSTSHDCWGTIPLPEKWNGTATQLYTIYRSHILALKTINFNSILVHNPDGMPTDRQLLDRATRLGVEGQVSVEEPAMVENTTRRWGH